MITRALEKAQTRIEELNFDARKHVLSYDDVLNIQRQSVYARRNVLLTGDNAAIDTEIARIAESSEGFAEVIESKKKELGDSFHAVVRRFLLQTTDFLWVEHLEAMEYLRNSVNLRAYGQRDPLVEYKKEGLKLFQTMENSYLAQAANVLPNLGTTTGVGPGTTSKEAGVIHKAVRTITAPTGVVSKTEHGRNDRVVITNGTERREMKFKKAEPLLASGEWQIATDK